MTSLVAQPCEVEFSFEKWFEEVPRLEFLYSNFLFTTSLDKALIMFELQTKETKALEAIVDDSFASLRGKTSIEGELGPVLCCQLLHSVHRKDCSFEGQIAVLKPSHIFLVNFSSSGEIALVKNIELYTKLSSFSLAPSHISFKRSSLVILTSWPKLELISFDKLSGILTTKRCENVDIPSSRLASIGDSDLFFFEESNQEWFSVKMIKIDDFEEDV